MAPVYVPSRTPEDWQRLLKDPVRHWRVGYSAWAVAHSWQGSNGWPPEVAQALAAAPEASLRSASPLLVIPEKVTPVAGAGEPPQSDVFVLAKTADSQLVSMTVEGKVDEPFGDGNETVAAWKRAGKTANRRVRLLQFLDKLQLTEAQADLVAYQLIQRTASAIIEAETFNAPHAVMLVHSFSPTREHVGAFEALASAYGVAVLAGQLAELPHPGAIRLFIGWVQGDPRYLSAPVSS